MTGLSLYELERVARGGEIDSETLMGYVRSNPGSRGEQIAAGLLTNVKIMRPVMKRLIESGRVRTAGERRGMTYSPV